MVFVHTRNGTAQSAMVMKEKATQNGELGCFEPEDNSQLGLAKNSMKTSRNRQLQVRLGCISIVTDELYLRSCFPLDLVSTTLECSGRIVTWWRSISGRGSLRSDFSYHAYS